MCTEAISSILSALVTASWKFLNSNVVIAAVGGLVGAFGGALGAQRIIERVRKREETLNELRNTNAAIMVAHTICNSALVLKKQHVQPIRENFLKIREAAEAFTAKRDAKQISLDVEFQFAMDFRTYPALIVPLETLKNLVFEKISTVGRPLALVAVTEQSLTGLNNAIAKRDQLIERFQTGEIPEKLRPHYYLGVPFSGGHVNQEFPDLVEASYSYVDDLAFFSYLLCTDLMKHGAKVREALTNMSSRQVPKVIEADFSAPIKSGLMPSASKYGDWTNGFVGRSEI